jgi:hypothetical protein
MSTEDLSLLIGGNTKVKAEHGVYRFSQLNMINLPNAISNIKITSSAIADTVAQNYLILPLSFRACIPGEVTQNNKCVPCPKGTFSFYPW